MQTTANDVKRHHPGSVVRIAGVVAPSLLGALAAVGLWHVVTRVAGAVRSGAPTTPATALLGALAVVGLAGLGWLLLGVLLEALARVPGTVGRAAATASAALSPAVVRRVAALVLGVGVGAGVSGGGAHAAPRPVAAVVTQVGAAVLGTPGSGPSVGTPVGAAVLGTPGSGPSVGTLPDPSWDLAPDPGWTPEPPRVRPQPDLAVLGGHARAVDDAAEVVVRRGDSLWSIAARHLGEDAADAEIAAAWPRWYAANRAVVGPDPDLLRPGQVLRAPQGAARQPADSPARTPAGSPAGTASGAGS